MLQILPSHRPALLGLLTLVVLPVMFRWVEARREGKKNAPASRV
ncbi:MAG: hypothetical protein ACK5NY_05210 [Burkholderiaceae bacterium]